jgi:hypothetical protein
MSLRTQETNVRTACKKKSARRRIYPLQMKDFDGNSVAVQRTISYIVRSHRAGSQGLLADVQRAVWSLNSSLPLADVRTFQEIFDKSLARTSFTLAMVAIAGAMALLIGWWEFTA